MTLREVQRHGDEGPLPTARSTGTGTMSASRQSGSEIHSLSVNVSMIGNALAHRTVMRSGLIAGGIAGLAGTWAMNEVQRWWTLARDGRAPHSAGGKHDARDWQERVEHQNSNELAAQSLAAVIIRRRLTHDELRIAAPLLHFAFGAAMGALYGAYAQSLEARRSGAAFGASVWLAADEIAMPVLGLSQSTVQRPLEMHLQSLVAHLVYGAITELARRPLQAQADVIAARSHA